MKGKAQHCIIILVLSIATLIMVGCSQTSGQQTSTSSSRTVHIGPVVYSKDELTAEELYRVADSTVLSAINQKLEEDYGQSGKPFLTKEVEAKRILIMSGSRVEGSKSDMVIGLFRRGDDGHWELIYKSYETPSYFPGPAGTARQKSDESKAHKYDGDYVEPEPVIE